MVAGIISETSVFYSILILLIAKVKSLRSELFWDITQR